MVNLNVGILMSRVRVEEKLLLEELEKRGVNIVRFGVNTPTTPR